MKVKLLDRKINEIEADFEVILVVDKNLNHEFIKDADKFALFNYKGEGNLLLAESRRLYIGVKALEYDRVRTALASAYNTLKGYAIKNFKIAFYKCGCDRRSAMAMVEGVLLGGYEFNKYKSDKKSSSLNEILISTQEYGGGSPDVKKMNTGCSRAS